MRLSTLGQSQKYPVKFLLRGTHIFMKEHYGKKINADKHTWAKCLTLTGFERGPNFHKDFKVVDNLLHDGSGTCTDMAVQFPTKVTHNVRLS